LTATPGGGPGEAAGAPWLSQGDVFPAISHLPILTAEGVAEHTTPRGVVVITQTCDAIRAVVVAVCPVVQLTGSQVSLASSGRTPRYTPLPLLGEDMFAALDTVASIQTEILSIEDRIRGVGTLVEIREFARAIGRKYARFAFPDDVSAWFKPLRDLAQKRARQPTTAEGVTFGQVQEIRIRADSGWAEPPYDLTISFVMKEKVLPFGVADDDAFGDVRDALARYRSMTSSRLAEVLQAHEDPDDAFLLWSSFARALIERCRAEGPKNVISSYDVEVVDPSQYSLESYRRSEALDLYHLSGPTLAE